MIVSIIMVTLVCFNLDNSIEMYRMIIAYIIMLPMIMFNRYTYINDESSKEKITTTYS